MHVEYFKSIYGHDDAASYLRSLFASALGGQRQTSLRSWAQVLGINPGFLSQVLHGKRRLSDAKAIKIAHTLGMEERESRYFRLLVRRDTAKSEALRQSIDAEIKEIGRARGDEAFDAESFAAIHDWYHVPILEMIYLQTLAYEPEAIAERLGIQALEAAVALERLERLGLIKKGGDGRYTRTQENFRFRSPHRNEAFARFHRQMMGLALHAMDRRPMTERVVMSQTFCINSAQVEEARLMTREYIEKMAGLFSKTSQPEDCYQLNVQFFRLTDGEQKSF